MKRMLFAWLGIFTTALSAPEVGLAAAGLKQNPQVTVSILEPHTPELAAVSNDETTKRAAEFIRALLGPLKLPSKLTVQLKECGSRELGYDPESSTATICYEALKAVDESLAHAVEAQRLDEQKAASAREPAYIMAALRAVTPAIFSMLEVPVWGRLSDAADHLTAYLMLQFGEEFAKNSILGSATYLRYASPGCASAKADGTQECARVFNYLCVAYGAAPRAFHPLWNRFFQPSASRVLHPEQARRLQERLRQRRDACLGARLPEEVGGMLKTVGKCAADAKQDAPEADSKRKFCECFVAADVPSIPPTVSPGEYEQIEQAFNLRIMPYVDPDAFARLRGRRSLVTNPSN